MTTTTTLSITFDEFTCAIVAARPPQKSMKSFMESITSEGPKEKHSHWIKVCENIRQAKNLPPTSKIWRKNIHKIFMDNLVQIELLIWKKMMKLSVNPEDRTDLYAALNAALSNAHAELQALSANRSN